jgi:hypothetical protein
MRSKAVAGIPAAGAAKLDPADGRAGRQERAARRRLQDAEASAWPRLLLLCVLKECQ